MSPDEPSTEPDAEIVTELVTRLQAELPLLAEHLRIWLQAHRAHPREISASSDPAGTTAVRVWLVTDDTGDGDASSNVVWDAERQMFGLVMKLENGILWYMGPQGSLVETIESI